LWADGPIVPACLKGRRDAAEALSMSTSTLTRKPIRLSLTCASCEGTAIVLIHESDSVFGAAHWACRHCGSSQNLPLLGFTLVDYDDDADGALADQLDE